MHIEDNVVHKSAPDDQLLVGGPFYEILSDPTSNTPFCVWQSKFPLF